MTPRATLVFLAALLFAATAPAQTLRWASQGDLQTADPHSQNESMTNMMNGQVYEKLVRRNKDLSIGPGLATEWSNPDPLTWRFKLRPGVKFHDGTPFSADDVVFSIERAKFETSNVKQYAHPVGTPRKLDALTVEFKLDKPNPIFLQHIDLLWMMSKAWVREAQGDAAAGLQEQGREPCQPERQWHRALHAGQPAAGGEGGAQAQPELVGQVRGQCAGGRVHADRQRRHAPGGAALGRARPGHRPVAARHPAAAPTGPSAGH